MKIRVLIALFPLLFAGCPTSPTPPTGTAKPAIAIPVPEFTLTERSGKPVALDDLKGKVWVASFVFTRCNGPCPAVTATMNRLQGELKLAEQADLRLVTFTVDPERDQTTELQEYANRYKAHKERWLFLTGKEETIHQLLKDGFKVTAQRSKNPKPGDEFDHSSRILVVDREGNIRGYYDGLQSETSHDPVADFNANINALKAQVQQLLAE